MIRVKNIILFICILVMFAIVGCGKNDMDSTTQSVTTETTQVDTTQAENDNLAEPTTESIPEEVDEDGFVVVNDYIKVTKEIIDVLNEPSLDGDIYMLLEEDATGNRTGYKDGWTRLLIDGYSFYVESDGVVVDETIKNEDDDDDEDNDGNQEDSKVEDLIFDSNNKIIVIDAANQIEDNSNEEQIGPDSETYKKMASSGSVGKITDAKEYDINLQIAIDLKAELVNRGYQVVMTRESNEVNISNKERVTIANDASAAAYIRIQLAESEDTNKSGVLAMNMTNDTPYNASAYKLSKRLSSFIIEGMVTNTGCDNNGILETDKMTAINWSQVPISIVNVGFITNADEEEILVTDEYQKKIAKGIADGLDNYYR